MTTSLTTWVAVAALVLAYLALVTGYLALRTLAGLRRDTALLERGLRGRRGRRGRQSLVEATQRQAEYTASVAEKLDELTARVEQTRTEAVSIADAGRLAAAGGLRQVALVRFDAFEGMSGRGSFALALLDAHGDGVSLSALAGHTDTRVYAKTISAGHGEQQLSPEEAEAVRAALGDRAAGRDAGQNAPSPQRRAS